MLLLGREEMCANCEHPFQGNANDVAVPVINPRFVIAERNVVRWSIVSIMLERGLIVLDILQQIAKVIG